MGKLFFLISIFSFSIAKSQNISINNDGSLPDASAILEIKSYNKGLLIPRMSSPQRNAIQNPALGLLVFDLSTTTFWFYTGLSWVELHNTVGWGVWQTHDYGIHYSSGNVGIGASPQNIYPLYVHQPNLNGQSIAMFASDDVWHSSIGLRNNTLNQQFTFIVGGINNQEVKPMNFGLMNAKLVRWSMVVDGLSNYVGFGSPDVKTPLPKSTIHVLTGDINIEQIGSGIIMKSPNGQCWRVTIDNFGSFVRAAISCP